MKAPSKNMSASIRAQHPVANAPESIDVQQQRGGGPTMTVPGTGLVEKAPGMAKHGDRSAEKYTEPMKRFGGG